MKIEIPVSDDLVERLENLSKKLGYTLEETSIIALKSGINYLMNQTCASCGESLGNTFVTCNSCSLMMDCGYLYLQFENAWKGDHWLVEPTTTCYSCLIFTELEENLESIVDTTSEEEIWGLKEKIQHIVEDIISESIRTTGDGETQVMSFPVKTEKVEPKTWEILSSKLDKFVIQILHE